MFTHSHIPDSLCAQHWLIPLWLPNHTPCMVYRVTDWHKGWEGGIKRAALATWGTCSAFYQIHSSDNTPTQQPVPSVCPPSNQYPLCVRLNSVPAASHITSSNPSPRVTQPFYSSHLPLHYTLQTRGSINPPPPPPPPPKLHNCL